MIDVKDLVVENPNKRVIVHPDGTREEVEIERGFAVPPGTTPWNHETAQLLQGDIRDVAVRAGESIKAGEVVNVQNGQAYRDIVAVANVENVISKSYEADKDMGLAIMDERYSVVIEPSSGFVIAYLVDNATGNAVSSYSISEESNSTHVRIARLTSELCIVCWIDSSYYQIFTTLSIAGGILKGSRSSMKDRYTSYQSIARLSDTTALSIYVNYSGANTMRARVVTVGGSDVTCGGYAEFTPKVNARSISAVSLPDAANGDKRVCICYQDVSDGNKGKAVIATVNSANAVAFGVPVAFTSTYATSIGCCGMDGDCVALSYVYISGNSRYCYVCALSYSGTVLRAGTPVLLSSDMKNPSFSAIGNLDGTLIALWNDDAYVVRRNDLQMTVLAESKHRYAASGGGLYVSASALNNNEMLVCYAGANGYSTTTVLSTDGSKVGGAIINVSRDAIALDSGGSGQTIRVAYSGMVQLAGAKAGDRIDSDGVRVYAPMDGWLIIRTAYFAPVMGVFESTTTVQTIELGFTPTLVFTYSGLNNSIWTDNSSDSDTRYYNLVRILSQAYKDPTSGEIVRGGFTHLGKSETSVYYIAFR